MDLSWYVSVYLVALALAVAQLAIFATLWQVGE